MKELKGNVKMCEDALTRADSMILKLQKAFSQGERDIENIETIFLTKAVDGWEPSKPFLS